MDTYEIELEIVVGEVLRRLHAPADVGERVPNGSDFALVFNAAWAEGCPATPRSTTTRRP